MVVHSSSSNGGTERRDGRILCAMETLEGISQRDLIFLRKDALARGMDDKALRRGIKSGALVRVRHGAYAFAEAWNDATAEERHLFRAAAVQRTSRCDGVLSHLTAAVCLGADVWDVPLEAVHVTRRDHKGGRREAGVVQHRGLLTGEEITTAGRWLCTNATRSALDVTTIMDVEHALVVVSSLLTMGLTTKGDLLEAGKSMTHVPGSLTTDLVLKLADKRLTTAGEARSFYAFWREGLPAPEPQYEVRGEAGRLLAQLDFAWPEHKVWVEFDGISKYTKLLRAGESPSDVVVREKKREDLVRRLTGWICVRLVWSDLAHPDRIAAKIRQAMRDQASRRAG